jgi:aminoglycoside phosphotransferase (APT) family kinase protein
MNVVTGADEVLQWLDDALDLTAPRVRPLDVMGLSREMWAVTGTWRDGEALDGIVKRDTGRGPLSGTMFTPGREAVAMRAVGPTGVAAPSVLAISPDDRMFLMERLPGDVDIDDDPDPRHRAIRDDFAGNVAALHRVDPVALGLPGADVLTTMHDAVLANVAAYEQVYRALAITDAVVDDAFAMARGLATADQSAPVLVHGDLGPGNLLFRDRTVTGLIDWEMWHLGHPMDDLASLWFRKCALRRDGDLADWFDAYVRAGGMALDTDALRYFRMVTMLRVVVAVLVMQEKDPDRDEGVAKMMLPLLAQAVDALDGRPTDGLPPI